MTVIAEKPNAQQDRQLLATDRCDACGAQALVRATLTSSGFDLMFCGHHSTRAEQKLRPLSSEWLDERRFLNA